MKKNNLIIVFTRNPELGKVKSRLAETVGKPAALRIYKCLLEHTEKIIRNTSCDKAVYYSVKVRRNDLWDDTIYLKYKQEGEDLGEKMSYAFQNAFNAGYHKVVIVGSDLFDLKEKHLQEALQKLNKHDVVIGPAHDGGYYLLGMKTLHSEVFKNKNWGTSSVFKNTLKDLSKSKIHLLEELNDIDTYEDMKNNSTLKKLILKHA